MKDVKVLPEIRDLLRPQNEQEQKNMEESIKEDGVVDKLVVWDRGKDMVLLDGHHRKEIADRLEAKYSLEKHKYASLDEAKLWVITHQLHSQDGRHLTDYERGCLALEKEPILAALGKKRKIEGGRKGGESSGGGKTSSGTGGPVASSSDHPTADTLAEEAGTSGRNLRRIKYLRDNATEEEKQKLQDPKKPAAVRTMEKKVRERKEGKKKKKPQKKKQTPKKKEAEQAPQKKNAERAQRVVDDPRIMELMLDSFDRGQEIEELLPELIEKRNDLSPKKIETFNNKVRTHRAMWTAIYYVFTNDYDYETEYQQIVGGKQQGDRGSIFEGVYRKNREVQESSFLKICDINPLDARNVKIRTQFMKQLVEYVKKNKKEKKAEEFVDFWETYSKKHGALLKKKGAKL